MPKILIVDDDQGTLNLIESCVIRITPRVYKARDGEEGWDTYKEVTPDLVITDYKMPRLDGYQLAKLIEKQNPSCPMILVSGYDDIDEIVKSHFENIYAKPFSIPSFLKTVRFLTKDRQKKL